jgi:hypothetical protein
MIDREFFRFHNLMSNNEIILGKEKLEILERTKSDFEIKQEAFENKEKKYK